MYDNQGAGKPGYLVGVQNHGVKHQLPKELRQYHKDDVSLHPKIILTHRQKCLLVLCDFMSLVWDVFQTRAKNSVASSSVLIITYMLVAWASQVAVVVKNPPANAGDIYLLHTSPHRCHCTSPPDSWSSEQWQLFHIVVSTYTSLWLL